MKTIFKVLIMTIAMITTTQAAEFLTVMSNVPFCDAPSDVVNIHYNARLLTDGTCATVPRNTKFEILQYNSEVAQVMFYNQQGQLIEQPVWVQMMNINKRALSSPTKDLASQVTGNAQPKQTTPAQRAGSADKDMDAFLKKAISETPWDQDQAYEGD